MQTDASIHLRNTYTQKVNEKKVTNLCQYFDTEIQTDNEHVPC